MVHAQQRRGEDCVRTFVAVEEGVEDSHRGAVHEDGTSGCLQMHQSK